jgi:RNA polymerase sigma factor (sigma-70 family)
VTHPAQPPEAQASGADRLSSARLSAQRSVDAVWRIESARLIAGLARVVRDVGLAEDLAQDALVAALEQWPQSGVPENPGAWLMAVARRRGVDTIRRAVTFERKVELLGRELTDSDNPMDEIEFDTHVDDDVLRLMFTACHPVLPLEARVALTLKMVAGLSTEEIARAFLVQTTAMAARITRAKKSLAEANVAFEVPVGDELTARLGSVLEAVYLVFNEGYTATTGRDWTRPSLCEEAMRLGRMLAALAPQQPEAHALVALMEIQASRLRARTGPDGQIVTLLDQNRARWDRLLITHGLAALDRAEQLGGHSSYVLQAQIAACHARAVRAEDTDWVRIAQLYRLLAELTGSPIVELNRAVAVSMADGPAAALSIIDGLLDVAALRNYHLLPSVRADLLTKLGRLPEAKIELERAAEMTSNERERELLLARAAELR